MRWFSLSNCSEIELETYLAEWTLFNPDYKIYVGCDSQNNPKKSKTILATVIVLHKAGSGGHVLYNKKSCPIIRSEFNRLWSEVECSMEAAEDLEKAGMGKPDYIDIDLNPDPKYRSNNLLRAAVGLIESRGMKARYKSFSNWSIPIADKICR